MAVRQVVNDYDTVLTFGKHKGESIREVCQTDISYITWLADEGVVQFEDEMLDSIRMDEMEKYPYEPEFWKDD